ncbi:signal peptidase I [Phototrophicus methaneseepsis]|uniref:Signal peptidase I n=1 Tax=Phototrophicus methaneseepsis TaxID=2710758 RepID=A0A7S8E7F6_9CHLR|nr:signal peptidase I [Phototrophicus methaneseepsis]QPC81746.1 signal peptidase I [Phototrophicus methaneseepsis]
MAVMPEKEQNPSLSRNPLGYGPVETEYLPVPRLKPRLRTSGLLAEILRTVIFVVVVTVLFDMAIPRSLVEGRSMEPSFQNGDRLIVSRLNYLFDTPTYSDVIVFNSMRPSEVGIMLIKRVIGLPGDTVEIRDQQVYVNGQQLKESYTYEECGTFSCSDRTVTLGPDEYFVMGDNRNHSTDSRSFGPVTIDHIVGRVLFRYWPISEFGVIQHEDAFHSTQPVEVDES